MRRRAIDYWETAREWKGWGQEGEKRGEPTRMDAPTSSFTALKHDGSSGEEEDVAFLKDVDAATAYQAKTVSDLASRRNWWAFWILGTINNLG